jgi:hypothetical protein
MLTFIQNIIEKIMNSTYEGPWYGRPLLVVPVVFILSMSSCTVLTGIDDTSELQIRNDLRKIQLGTMERLISDHGFNAISARCAVMGIDTNEQSMCKDASGVVE